MTDAVRREYELLAPVYDRLWRGYLRTTIARTLKPLSLAGDERVLDIGCGTGALLEALAARGPKATLEGIDLSPKMLARAQSRLGDRAQLRVGSADTLSYPDASFDIVVSSSMLHYVPRPHSPVLVEWARVLRPGGTMVITDWNRDYLGTRLNTAVLKIMGGTHPVYSASELMAAMAMAGMLITSAASYRAGTWGLCTAAGTRGG